MKRYDNLFGHVIEFNYNGRRIIGRVTNVSPKYIYIDGLRYHKYKVYIEGGTIKIIQ